MPKTRLVIAQPQEPDSLNPLFLSGDASTVVVPMIYSFLLTLDEHDTLRPDIAAEVPTMANGGISRDGLTITYHLRSDARWQDGKPVTARDVVFTFAAVMNPRNNVISRFGYDRVARVEAVNHTTVRVHLRRRYAPILNIFIGAAAGFGILPAHLLAGYPDLNHVPFNSAPLGSGPYRVVQWVRGDHLTLASNATYYKGRPHIAEIVLRFVADTNTILTQLQTHEADATLVADAAHLAQFRTIAGARVVRAPLAGVADLFFNLRNPALADVQVRRALVQAVDFPRLVRNATRGAQSFDHADRGLFFWGYDPSVKPPTYDPAAAARVLKPRHLTLQLAFVSGNAIASSVGLQLQRQLHDAGVELSLKTYSPMQFRAEASSGGPLYSGKYQIGFLEIYTNDDPDVDWNYDCAAIPPSGFNTSWYCDRATDLAAAAGLATYDHAARRHYASIVQQRLMEELPDIPIWQVNAIYVVPAGLRGFRPAALSPTWNIADWSLASTWRG